MKNKIYTVLRRMVAGVAAVCLVATAALAASTSKLAGYQVDLSQTSVSGLSSGAFMAAQFQVAYSSTLIGAGIVAGGPFYCAGSSPLTPFVLNATTICMNPEPGLGPDAAALLAQAKLFSQAGLIDDLGNLKKQKVYLFSGRADQVVKTQVVDQTNAFYKLAGLSAEQIKYVTDIDAGHAIITNNNKAVSCPDTATPYINDCHFMQSHDILMHIYGELKPPVSKLSGKIVKFDQSEFVKSFLASMSDDAYLYVPQSCETTACKVHVAFHGCGQGAAEIGDLFYRTTGYNELADSNSIIVLYPQAQVSNGFFSAFNPKGCWDFWGYSSFNQFAPNFYTKDAPQMSAVKAMLDRLGQARK